MGAQEPHINVNAAIPDMITPGIRFFKCAYLLSGVAFLTNAAPVWFVLQAFRYLRPFYCGNRAATESIRLSPLLGKVRFWLGSASI